MNERQLRSFLLASDLGSFSKAAAKSYVSTPAFVQQINLLERDLGFKLFDRSPKGVELTEAGRMFREKAAEMLWLYDEGVEEGRAMAEAQGRTLCIGIDSSERPPFLSALCACAKEQEPSMSIVFHEAPYSRLLESVADGNADLCFFARTPVCGELGLLFQALYRDEWAAIMSPSNKLSGKDLIRVEDLRGVIVGIEKVYQPIDSMALLIGELRAQDPDAAIDETTFTSSTPLELSISAKIMPMAKRYTKSFVPPLVAVDLDLPETDYGIVYREDGGEEVDRFIEIAEGFFQQEDAS